MYNLSWSYWCYIMKEGMLYCLICSDSVDMIQLETHFQKMYGIIIIMRIPWFDVCPVGFKTQAMQWNGVFG
jgi:hypothetical protein